MVQHGKNLAAEHKLAPGRPRERLLARLAANQQLLLDVHNLLTEDVRSEHRITPAGEWLLDNFYVIEEQIRTARRHLPPGYSRKLPRLSSGPSSGLPRVYDIALEAIAHSDGRVDQESFTGFIAAYQTGASLQLGELWAIPIMLRLALIENLRRIAARIAAERLDRNRAGYWADHLTKTAVKESNSLILAIADMVRSNPPIVSAFVAELTRRLHGQGPALALPLTWIEQRLAESGSTIEQLVRLDSQQQAADQVSISNSIGSLRFLGAMDWRKFVEEMSSVELYLRSDPAGVYSTMDFATRDRYRHVVEQLAKGSAHSELEVAQQALSLAQSAAQAQGLSAIPAHIGYFLIDAGRDELERCLKLRTTPGRLLAKAFHQQHLLLYIGSIWVLTVLVAGSLTVQAAVDGVPAWLLAVVGLLALLGASQLAVSLVNWAATLWAVPRLLPRLDYSAGIPQESQTLVVVPTMLTSELGLEHLIQALEVRFLANRQPNIHFGLLTDFGDADAEILSEDGPLLALAAQRVRELNAKYNAEAAGPFYLFHRPRCWNPQERIWMGYERKRGKLADLNALLRGRGGGRFAQVVGDVAALQGVKYVITLDTDTQLARDTAAQFAGAMAHPLNRPRYDAVTQRVVTGYGILQPRVAESLTGANRSRFALLCASELGIDPYTRAVSDVYQDLFAEGSFIGKGIYDVDAFEQALTGRFPENRILSHDLLEGCYARSGLLSDVQLYEESPSRYSADVSRRQRWIRGDWQIAQWALPYVPGADGRLQRNPLSHLSRWKVADNLRRSLTAAALLLLLVLGLTLLPDPPLWLLAVLGISLLPAALAAALSTLSKPAEVTLKQHWGIAAQTAGKHLAQALFAFACLPHEAYYSLGAIVRAGWRLLVSHKLLLQWNPSGEADRSQRRDLAGEYQEMWFGPLLALAMAITLATIKPAGLVLATPVLCLWLAAPTLAWWLSRPLVYRGHQLSAQQLRFLRQVARRTWAFFETFIGAADNWLPPDNYQEQPAPVLAHRTSPTNIGISLLANLAAYDFGFIPAGALINRTTHTLATMDGLERYKGHFFNWYDTRTLEPLVPRYISSVDSGNLAGHLLTLREGLLGLAHDRVLGSNVFTGMADTLALALAAAETNKARQAPGLALPVPLLQLQQELASTTHSPPATLSATQAKLAELAALADAAVASSAGEARGPGGEMQWWLQRCAAQCVNARDELAMLTPWTQLPPAPSGCSALPGLEAIPTLAELAALAEQLQPELTQQLSRVATPEARAWLETLQRCVAQASELAAQRLMACMELARQCVELSEMEYGFLYDATRKLLAIGYNVSEGRRDTSYYDLLASEARFATFIAIAQGQLPQESWFALGRLLTTAAGQPVLLSWSGSMFEYLMPLLVMPTYPNTLLDETYKTVVARQIDYGTTRSVPWGISESGYNAIDAHQNYQYRAFGVPGLGLKRGLADDLVIAPYASALVLMVAPAEACTNLERLDASGYCSRYGYFEAIDFTPSRMPRGQTSVVVRSFMAHHQGMSLLALGRLLLGEPMQQRFTSDPRFQATLLLLQERIPQATTFYTHTTELAEYQLAPSSTETQIRVFTTPDTPHPEVQLLSNGRYHVMVTNAGGGYSRWQDLAVTRWREDPTCDSWGTFCYLRDVTSGATWSAAFQPALGAVKRYEAVFSEGRAEFRGQAHDFEIHTEIAVSPEDDIELRRLHITNRARIRRAIDVTSYAEVVLAPAPADDLHPAFSKLFVQTEILPQHQAILCTRRPRSQGDETPWMLHLLAVHGAQVGRVSYETDRLQFIGRGNTGASPRALSGSGDGYAESLSDSAGAVLDPIAAIRCRILLEPGESATLNFVTGVGSTRETVENLVVKYQDRRLADRVFELAWTHAQVLLRQINASESDAQLYCQLANSIIYAQGALRADPTILGKNERGQSGLWGHAISGDLPIVLLQIEDPANLELVRQLVQAHAYWRLKGLAVDLVIWNEDRAGYRQLLHDQIMGLIAAGIEFNVTDRPGGIFVRPADQLAQEDRILIQSVARVILSDSRGTLAEQLNAARAPLAIMPQLTPARERRPEPPIIVPSPRQDLQFFNGLGGFTPDGREYVITTAQGQRTPAPWINVLANPKFGTVVSESGAAYTWGENAHEFRLTPWSNDPVSDSGGEAFYIRDEERGHYWSPTPLPCRGSTPYVTRHGFGYSVFEHTERGVRSELWIYVALDAAVKFAVLKVRNESGRARKLSVTGYAEWVLGDLRAKTAMHVITQIDALTGALFARNAYNTEFRERTAFFDVDDLTRGASGDRAEFVGRNGTLSAPAALKRVRLSGRTGAALDPCAALQVYFELAAGQEREITFRLGVGLNTDEARSLVQRFRGAAAAQLALEQVWQYWTHTLGAVHVETPDPALNMLANGWLLYQTLACRLWARSATYQSGGAFGFRDQLQDAMAMIHARPQVLREQLLLCAAHQFPEGDVQHWWHPPAGRGVRTHCSDDYLWLPLAAWRYVTSTGDTGVLDEPVHFIQGRPLSAEEDSYYDQPERTEETASLYDHCVRAITNGLSTGAHGLPFIGSGDWNDGYNLVGEKGRGESVWLGFFLYFVLLRFAEVARGHGDLAFAARCTAAAEPLRRSLDLHGWDGAWYRRAYFDDGTPLGSAVNAECQIDSIAQSWSVLSGAADAQRARQAMDSLEQRLVHREPELVQLLAPPFDKSALNPGYIKGYVPGVRENGGQYTHAAVWAAMAFASQGDAPRAWELFDMINPINHALTEAQTAVYKVEPYVVAADVYAAPQHLGRGGWTWYTGSSGWLYRLIVEALLGLTLEVDRLRLAPCLPAHWEEFKLHYRYRETVYHLTARQVPEDSGALRIVVDGAEQPGDTFLVVDDRQEHWVEISTPPATGRGPATENSPGSVAP